MLLRTSLTSPFGRKARLAASQLGLEDRIEVVHGDTLDPDDPLRRDNPLGKIPVLVLEDGRSLFDSRVILEYFDWLAGGERLFPTDPAARFDCLRQQALADGIMDAAVLVVYEGRYRPPEKAHDGWLDLQRGKMIRALAQVAKDVAEHRLDPTSFNAGTLSLACALGYVDWRRQVEWRELEPSLIPWYDAFRASCPVFDQTAPPA